MINNKKTVLFFIFDGFADWEITYAMAGIRKSNCYHVKTMALEKEPVIAMSGLSIIPSLDFIPHIDLKDIDRDNTAMLVLPGGSSSLHKDRGEEIELLIAHCIEMQIPIATLHTSLKYPDNITHEFITAPFEPTEDFSCIGSTGSIEFAKAIFEELDIADNEFTLGWSQSFEANVV